MAKVEHVKAIVGAQCPVALAGALSANSAPQPIYALQALVSTPLLHATVAGKNLQDHTVRTAHEIL